MDSVPLRYVRAGRRLDRARARRDRRAPRQGARARRRAARQAWATWQATACFPLTSRELARAIGQLLRAALEAKLGPLRFPYDR